MSKVKGMLDKAKTAKQLNNRVLTSMGLIDNINLRFAGRILNKYGVSRGTDHFIALVLRRYPNLLAETKEAGGAGNPLSIKNYLNVHNHIINRKEETVKRLYQCFTKHVTAPLRTSSGESRSTVKTQDIRQGHNVFAVTDHLNTSLSIGLLERILTQEKSTLAKNAVSRTSNLYLFHNIENAASHISNTYLLNSIKNAEYNTVLSTSAERLLSFRREKPDWGSIGEKEDAFRSQALRDTAETDEVMQDSKEILREMKELLPAILPYKTKVVTKLKTLPNLLVQRNIIDLKCGGHYINKAEARVFSSDSWTEYKSLQHEAPDKTVVSIMDDRRNAQPYSTQNIVEENAEKLSFRKELTHKASYNAGIKQEEIDIGPHNQVTQQGSLVLHKPAAAEASAIVKKPEQTGLYDKTKKQTKALKDMDSQDISLLADRVFKILEKRIAIQKDRRGLL